jgi:hypothetical protein
MAIRYRSWRGAQLNLAVEFCLQKVVVDAKLTCINHPDTPTN